MKTQILSTVLLYLTALFWGTSFAARKVGLLYITPLFFNGLRFLLGFLFIFVIYVFYQKGRLDPSKPKNGEKLFPLRKQLRGGIYMGLILSMGALFQQFALVWGTAGKTAFFTALYTIIVPIISAVFLRRKIKGRVWVGAVVAVAGIYLISGSGFLSMSKSDILALLCALSFAIQILVTAGYSPYSNGLFLSMVQAFVAGSTNLILGIIFESGNSFSRVAEGFWPLIVASFIAISLPYTFQILAQKNVPPSIASIILSLESVFGALFGAVVLNERMSPGQLAGCGLIFTAIVIAQIDTGKGRVSNKHETHKCKKFQ